MRRYGNLRHYRVRTLSLDSLICTLTLNLERKKFNADLASTLTKSLKVMLTHTTSERGRSAVPLISNSEGISPFPVKITVKVGNVEVG